RSGTRAAVDYSSYYYGEPNPMKRERTPRAKGPLTRVMITYVPSLGMIAEHDAKMVHMDKKLDPWDANHRKKFIKAISAAVPNLDEADADSQLVNIAEQMMVKAQTESAKSTPPAAPLELDLTKVVRPELFFTGDVSGLTVPVIVSQGDNPAAR